MKPFLLILLLFHTLVASTQPKNSLQRLERKKIREEKETAFRLINITYQLKMDSLKGFSVKKTEKNKRIRMEAYQKIEQNSLSRKLYPTKYRLSSGFAELSFTGFTVLAKKDKDQYPFGIDAGNGASLGLGYKYSNTNALKLGTFFNIASIRTSSFFEYALRKESGQLEKIPIGEKMESEWKMFGLYLGNSFYVRGNKSSLELTAKINLTFESVNILNKIYRRSADSTYSDVVFYPQQKYVHLMPAFECNYLYSASPYFRFQIGAGIAQYLNPTKTLMQTTMDNSGISTNKSINISNPTTLLTWHAGFIFRFYNRISGSDQKFNERKYKDLHEEKIFMKRRI